METFKRIVHERFGLPVELIDDAMTPADIPEWDSMGYLLFIADLEKEFRVSFSMDEVLSTRSLGDVRALLVGKGIEL